MKKPKPLPYIPKKERKFHEIEQIFTVLKEEITAGNANPVVIQDCRAADSEELNDEQLYYEQELSTISGGQGPGSKAKYATTYVESRTLHQFTASHEELLLEHPGLDDSLIVAFFQGIFEFRCEPLSAIAFLHDNIAVIRYITGVKLHLYFASHKVSLLRSDDASELILNMPRTQSAQWARIFDILIAQVIGLTKVEVVIHDFFTAGSTPDQKGEPVLLPAPWRDGVWAIIDDSLVAKDGTPKVAGVPYPAFLRQLMRLPISIKISVVLLGARDAEQFRFQEALNLSLKNLGHGARNCQCREASMVEECCFWRDAKDIGASK